MALIEIIPNIFAIIGSLIGVIMLWQFSNTAGGAVAKALKLMLTGIVFSVFLHSLVEVMALAGLLSDRVLFPIMGVLLSIGSVLFIIAGWIGMKAFKR